MPRICGCIDDTLEIKKKLLKKYNLARINDDGRTIYIGIIFHICYKNVADNIENDISYTVDMLNLDFSKQCTNFDYGALKYTDSSLKQTYTSYVSLAKECNIVFYKKDVIYMPLDAQLSSNISVLDKNIKGSSPAIESGKYLNLWVAEFNNGLLGYAQFPWDNSPSTDGVIIAKGTFGMNPEYPEFNLNKTLTHEVGHWLGLYHVFQGTFAYGGGNIDYTTGTPEEEIQEMKGDCVADTPPQAIPTYGNPFGTPNTWPISKIPDESKEFRHMFMNFMDYSDDVALFMFTQDQVIKIRQMIYMYRPNILSNNPITQPQPQPIPAFPITKCDFEMDKPNGWIEGPTFINNLSGSNVQITYVGPYSGAKCLRTNRTGRAELKINLSTATDAALTLFIRPYNHYTYVWVRPPGGDKWYSAKIPTSLYYNMFSFNLPKPYSSIGREHYRIRLGTNGSSNTYSYFDNVTIFDTTTARIPMNSIQIGYKHDRDWKEILAEKSEKIKSALKLTH